MNRAPFGRPFMTWTVPLCSLMIWSTMASPRPGALFLRREMGQEELVLVLGRDPGSAVRDFDVHLVGLFVERCANDDFTLFIHGVNGVVDQVDEDPLHLLGIEGQDRRHVGPDVDLDRDVGEDAPEQGHDLGDDVPEAGRLEVDLGQAGEIRELVDEGLDRLGLLDDDPGPLLDHLAAARVGLLEVLQDPLGVELDGRQRVLDLVGDALGDFLPGGDLLGLDQLAEVVEDDDHAREVLAGLPERGQGQGDGGLLAVEMELDLLVGDAVSGLGRGVEGLHELAVALGREDVLVGAAGDAVGREGEHVPGRGIDRGDRPPGGDGQDARC